jgi:hypothetical protein
VVDNLPHVIVRARPIQPARKEIVDGQRFNGGHLDALGERQVPYIRPPVAFGACTAVVLWTSHGSGSVSLQSE